MTPADLHRLIQTMTLQPFDEHAVEDNVRELCQAKDLVDATREYVAAIEAALVKQLPKGVVEIEGIGTVERKAGAKRTKWDHSRVAHVVALQAVEAREPDPDTGEVADPAVAAVDALLGVAGISYWRSGALKGMGLDPDDYSDTEWGRPSVLLRRNVDEVAAA